VGGEEKGWWGAGRCGEGVRRWRVELLIYREWERERGKGRGGRGGKGRGKVKEGGGGEGGKGGDGRVLEGRSSRGCLKE
jgi:hypothetical protein